MRRIGSFTLTFLYDTPTDGAPGAGAGGGPTGAASPGAGSGAPSPTPDPTPPARVAPAGAPPAVAPPAKKYEYGEDRGDWVPPHRLTEVAGKARRFETEAGRLKAMIEAGTGYKVGEPGEPESPEIVEARELLMTKILSPEIRKGLELLVKHGEALSQLATRGGDLISTTDQHWERLGFQTVEGLHAAIAKDMNVTPDKLSEYQKSVIGTAFVNYLEASPTIMQRYVRGDAKVADDFLAEFRSGFFDPFRRVAQAGGAGIARQNANLPGPPKPGAVVPAGGAPPKKKTEDDIHDDAWNSFKAINEGAR